MNMNKLLENQVAIITGAASGVGKASTLLFTDHGAKVLALDIDADALTALASEVAERGRSVETAICNVADESEVNAAVTTAVELFGRLDIMFNNAGIQIRPKPVKENSDAFLDGTQAELETLSAVNSAGVVSGCRAAIAQFIRQGDGGCIVNTASIAGLFGYASPVYGATKGFVTSLTRSLAIQYAEHDIRINSLCPSGMVTNFGPWGTSAHTEELEKLSARMQPLGRNIEPIECAHAALFLASRLAPNITGVNLPIDGGLSAGKK